MVSSINDLHGGGDIGDSKQGRVQADWRTGLDVKMLLYSKNSLNKMGCSLIRTSTSRNNQECLNVQIPGVELLTS